MVKYKWVITMKKYYAIQLENDSKIVTSWEECQKIIKNSYVRFKSFSDLESAEQYLSSEHQAPYFEIPTAYIDGSYDEKTGCYSFGGVLWIESKKYVFSKKYLPDEYSSSRNVAGEIKGAAYIINFCLKRNIKHLRIGYDYVGIEKWFHKAWKANSLISQKYVEFADRIGNQIQIDFFKIKSHTNNEYNEMADLLAKKALGL